MAAMRSARSPGMGCEESFDDGRVAVRDERVGCGGGDRLGRIAERVLEQMLRCVVVECGDREDHIAARRLGEFGELQAGGVGPSGLRGERRALGRADVLGFAARREDRVPRNARSHDDHDDDDRATSIYTPACSDVRTTSRAPSSAASRLRCSASKNSAESDSASASSRSTSSER